MSGFELKRRDFLGAATGLLAAAGLSASAQAGERPRVANPRATDGDERHEPNWDERLTLTVGPNKADLVGSDDRVLQAAVDYVARLGGGTVRVLPGYFDVFVELIAAGQDQAAQQAAALKMNQMQLDMWDFSTSGGKLNIAFSYVYMLVTVALWNIAAGTAYRYVTADPAAG